MEETTAKTTETSATQKKKYNFFNGDVIIWVVVGLLFLISILAVFSASSALAYREGKSIFTYLFRHAGFVAFGMISLWGCYIIPIKWYKILSQPAFILTCILLIATIFFGKNINGANRWLQLGPLTFQPSELAKITIVLFLAKSIEKYDLTSFKEYFLRIVIPVGIMLVSILVGSVSVTLVLGFLSFAILLIAGIKWSHLMKTIGIAIIALVAFIGINSVTNIFPRFNTATSRLTTFFTDGENQEEEMTREEIQRQADKTFQEDMAEIAVSNGKFLGKGPGNSDLRNILPHSYSDFIYAIIIEEYGLFGGTVVLLLYLTLFFRCLILAKRCSRIFSAITVAGLGLMITLQAMLHIYVNLGLAPVTGHTLPLISLGGTSYVILSGAFGIILAISRTLDSKKTNPDQQDYVTIETVTETPDTTAK